MRTKSIYLLLLLAIMPLCAFSQSKSAFEIKDGHFYRNGKVTPVLSGEMHYARIPHQYWRHRLQMMKGMGLNTVATYVSGIFMNRSRGSGILPVTRIWPSL